MMCEVKIEEVGDYSVMIRYTAPIMIRSLEIFLKIQEYKNIPFMHLVSREALDSDNNLILYFDKNVKEIFSKGDECWLGLFGSHYALAKLL